MNRDKLSTDLNTQAHGRVDGVLLLLKAVAVLMFSLDTVMPPVALVLTASALGGLALAAFLAYQPYLHPTVNRASSAFYAAYCWACVCLIMLQIRNNPVVRAPVLSPLYSHVTLLYTHFHCHR